MTTLAEYLASNGAKTLTALSEELGVSKSRLSQLRAATEWPPELALKVEAATAGQINAGSLSQVVKMARAG